MFALSGLFAALMASCVSVDSHLIDPEAEGDSKTVTFTVRTPYSSPSTYAMSIGEENEIETIDVLAFSYNTITLQEEYSYRAEGYNITSVSAVVPYEKQFKVILNKSLNATDRYRLVFLANVKDELDAMYLVGGTEKELMLANILKTVTGAWDVTTPTMSFPMWGECQQLVVIDGTQSSLTSIAGSKINLLRSVVSIEVDGSAVTSQFHLEDVYLYNRQTSGRVAPKGSFYVHGGYVGENSVAGTGYVTKPSLPNSPSKVFGPLQFHLPTGVYKSEREIYTFETDSVANGDDFSPAAVVVGGTYIPTGVRQYYRIDFDHRTPAPANTFVSYRPLLRNHRYRMIINQVTADGHNTPDSAFYGKKGKLDVKVIDWNLGDSATVTVSETHTLAISISKTDTLIAHGASDTYSGYIGVTSNHPDGWTVTSESSWITVDDPAPVKHYDGYLHYTIGTGQPTLPGRDGYITVRAGNLAKRIKITDYKPF
jgi:hypothetical protein